MSENPREVLIVISVSNDTGEVEGVWDPEKKKWLACWSMNDAQWSDEFTELSEALGVKITRSLDKALKKSLLDHVKEEWGL